jgi:hypothetical protein
MGQSLKQNSRPQVQMPAHRPSVLGLPYRRPAHLVYHPPNSDATSSTGPRISAGHFADAAAVVIVIVIVTVLVPALDRHRGPDPVVVVLPTSRSVPAPVLVPVLLSAHSSAPDATAGTVKHSMCSMCSMVLLSHPAASDFPKWKPTVAGVELRARCAVVAGLGVVSESEFVARRYSADCDLDSHV